MLFQIISAIASASAFAAPCDLALSKAVAEGAIDPETLSVRQRCEETIYRDRKAKETFYVCVFSGEAPQSREEVYGEKPLTVIYAEEESSNEHFKEIIGIWYSRNTKATAIRSEEENVAVTVGKLGPNITRRRLRKRSPNQTIDKITLSLLEKNLRHERHIKRGSKVIKQLLEKSYECEKSYSQVALDEIEREKKKKKQIDFQLIKVDGTVKVKPEKPTHRNSGITGGSD